MVKTIFFYWDGYIHESRLKILRDCVYSTRVFNPDRKIVIVSNFLKQDLFDSKFRIQVLPWGEDLFYNLPIPFELIKEHYLPAGARELSDLMRLVLLYKFGGSYIDTDDIAIKAICNTPNLVCRSYDPHTCHYNQLTPEDCIDGKYREIEGFDHLTMFPRNDCWLNFEPKSQFIYDLLSNPKVIEAGKALYIGDNTSWQSLTLETCKKHIDTIGVTFNLGLTLLYLYEDFVSASSYFDRCMEGGELCEEWQQLPGMGDYEWGFYKTDKETALKFYYKIYWKYPYLSHMWLHSKDMKEEWMLEELDENEKYSVSTWIYNEIRKKIDVFSNNTNALEST